MTESKEPWINVSPWNDLHSGNQCLAIRALEPSRAVLKDCLAIIDGVAPLLAEMKEDKLPEGWRDEPGIGLLIGFCASKIGAVGRLSAQRVSEAIGSRGPAGRLTDEDARGLAHHLLYQQRYGALRFAIELVAKPGNFTADERLEIVPVLRRRWADLSESLKEDCVRLIARTDRPAVVSDILRELADQPSTNDKTRAVITKELARIEP